MNNYCFEHLRSLVDENVPESEQLEYKRELHLNTAKEKKEFLADVSAFANTKGGIICYGIEEQKKGVNPMQIVALEVDNLDKLKLKLDSLVRDGVSPRIDDFQVIALEASPNKYVILIKVQESVDTPHQVIYDKTNKYFQRGAAGKYQMNDNQIEKAIYKRDCLQKDIRSFLENRYADMAKNQFPVELFPFPKIVFSLVPISNFKEETVDMNSQEAKGLPPLGGGNRDYKLNSKGRICYSTMPGNSLRNAYVQLYRNGTIETVNSYALIPSNGKISVGTLERYLLEFIDIYLDFYIQNEIEFPVDAHLKLLGMKGFTINSGRLNSLYELSQFEDDEMVFPTIRIDRKHTGNAMFVVTWFNLIWNSCGINRSLHFNEAGQWIGEYPDR